MASRLWAVGFRQHIGTTNRDPELRCVRAEHSLADLGTSHSPTSETYSIKAVGLRN